MAATKHDARTDVERGQLFLFIDGKPVAFGKSATLTMSTDAWDCTNKMTGGWKCQLPGEKSFSVKSDALIATGDGQQSLDAIMEGAINDQTFEFLFGHVVKTNVSAFGGEFAIDTAKKHFKGTVMTSSIEVTSASGEAPTYSASFEGAGALEIVKPAPAV